jgi:hypothetical protein
VVMTFMYRNTVVLSYTRSSAVLTTELRCMSYAQPCVDIGRGHLPRTVSKPPALTTPQVQLLSIYESLYTTNCTPYNPNLEQNVISNGKKY